MGHVASGSGGRGFGRRLFLKAAALLSFVLGVPSALRGFFLEDEFPVRTVEKDNFRFDPKTGLVNYTDDKKPEPYMLRVDGLVESQAGFSYAELRAFPGVIQVSDFHCVEGWSVGDVRWGGFRFGEILKRVKPKPGADYIVFHSLGETEGRPGGQGYYIESMPLKDLLDPGKECLMALDMSGAPLPHDHGAPLRLVAPFSLGYKNIKYVRRVEFSEKPRKGWWTLANPIYPITAPVPAERLRKKP